MSKKTRNYHALNAIQRKAGPMESVKRKTQRGKEEVMKDNFHYCNMCGKEMPIENECIFYYEDSEARPLCFPCGIKLR